MRSNRSVKPLAAIGALTTLAAPATVAIAADNPTAAAAPEQGARLTAPLAGHTHVASQMRHLVRDDLVRDVVRLHQRFVRLRGDKAGSSHAYRERLSALSARRLSHKRRSLRRDIRKLKTAGATSAGGGGAASGTLQAIAACESGGNPSAVDPSGTYRGKYQFSRATWSAMGGSGDPAGAPEAEQDRRAAILYSQAGAGQWPVCGS